MTNPDYTAICLVVDRSGSMWLIHRAAEEAINGFLTSQKSAEGRRTVRIVQFDDQHEVVFPSTDSKDLPVFELHPRGATALLDAMGFALVSFGDELAAMNETERPGHVVFAIMTDGNENASTEYQLAQIKAMVEKQRDEYGWEILYLGANQDAITVAEGFGIRRGQTMTYAPTDYGTRSMVDTVDSYVAATACGQSASFSEGQRRDAVK